MDLLAGRLPCLEPDKAYVSSMLFLPKAGLAVQALKSALEFDTSGKDDRGRPIMVKNYLWEETEHHLVIPREFLHPSQYTQYAFPFIDLNPRRFPRSGLISTSEPHDDIQRMALDAMLRSHSGILNLGTGKGKTFLALKHGAILGCPILIVVPDSTLMGQWLARINDHLELPLGEKVGIIQASTMDWQHPVTVAMIHTLAARIQSGDIPPELPYYFGAIYYDEAHHLAAPVFSQTASLCRGVRVGLTATATRTDGLQFVFNYHLGPVFFSDLRTDLKPEFYIQQTSCEVDLDDDRVRDTTGEVHLGRLRANMCLFPGVNDFRYAHIKMAYDDGRKILCLSHSKQQLYMMSEMFPEAGLIVQETPVLERDSIVKKSRITFAISKLGKEGLDNEDMDTVFYLTPFSNPNDLQQSLGRILRDPSKRSPGKVKRQPIAILFDDVKIDPLHRMCMSLRRLLKSWGIRYQTYRAQAI